ncbi:MAG: Crp/Fnr family transcriptional regulator [Desulfuromonas sp.]|nr:MAG: Crp/Fnr family transcriptional regulator [Desulfuromonas sp.]
MQLKDDLLQCPMFSGVTDEDLKFLAGVIRQRVCEKGELLFSEGDAAAGFYVLAEGRVKVYKLSPDGKERILHIVQPGTSFAEAAIFGDGHYPAYAEPLQKSRLLFFPKREFLDLLHNKSQIAINMIGGLSRFLRQFATQVEQLTFQDVPARLAKYILGLAGDENDEVLLPIPKGELASNLGTVSETLSRTFRKLSEEGLISVKGKQIRIEDRDSLEDIAESTKER